MSRKKIMPRVEVDRIGDDLVATQVWMDGTRHQLIMPRDQALIVADWFYELAEDHQPAVAAEPQPSPAQEDEAGREGDCTRTAAQPGSIWWSCSRCNQLNSPSLEFCRHCITGKRPDVSGAVVRKT